MFKRLAIAVTTLLLTACGTFIEKDNTPTPAALTPVTAEITPHQRWSVKTGAGAGDDYLKLSPSLSGNAIYTTSAKGLVTATDISNGHAKWSINANLPITSGPGVGAGLVVMGSRRGDVVALQQVDGQLRWKVSVPGEILAKPVISNNIVIIKTIDGTVHALSTQDGRQLWHYQQSEPTLILRGSSTPRAQDNALFVGFANGTLTKLNLNNGFLDWTKTIAVPEGAFSIERMVDIDADPVLFEHHVYVATYQGNIASLNWHGGSVLWSHDISSYTGMSADSDAIYLSDAKSHIWAFNANSGLVNWRQTQLEARNVGSPAMMGQYLVIGDAEGYLHWLNKRDGHIAAREFVGNAIIAAPIVENNVLYALTKNGSLVAYTLSS